MVWAILRRAPNKAYLEFDLQPAIKVVYTFSLEMHKKNITPKEKKCVGYEEGYKYHINKARNKDITGVKRKGRRFEREGFDCSFLSNFRASAKG